MREPDFQPLEETVELRQYWYVLRRRRWVLLTTFVLVFLSALIYTFSRTPTYRATATVIIDPVMPRPTSFTERGVGRYPDEFYDSQFEILKSYSVAQVAFENLGLAESPEFEGANDPVDWFRGGLSVQLLRNTQLLEISYEHPDPAAAAERANGVAKAYLQRNLEGRREVSRDAFTWLSEQISVLKTEVKASETALLEYKQKEDILSLEKRQPLVEDRLSVLSERHADATIARQELETLWQEVQELREQPTMLEALPKVVENSAIQGLKTQCIQLEAELAQNALKFGPTHPDIKRAQQQVDTLRALLAAEVDKVAKSVEVEYRLSRTNEEAIGASLEDLKQQSAELARAAVQVAALKREAESNREMYGALLQRLKETDVGGTVTVNNARIVDHARPPSTPHKPKKRRSLALAFVLALFLGVGLCFLLEAFDNGIHNEEDVKVYLGLPVIGAIPRARIEGRDHPPEVAHAYGDIRTGLAFYGQKHLLRSLLVTSSIPEEGKTTSVIGLAHTFARTGSRVLILEADLWRPQLRKPFGFADGPGLAEVLSGDAALDDVLVRTGPHGLTLLTSGVIPPHREAVLSSEAMRNVLEKVVEDFDLVIVDAPPLSASLEVASLGQMADAVVFAVRAGSTPRQAARRSVERLRELGCNMVGVILTAFDPASGDPDAYSYFSYRYSYHQSDKPNKARPTAASELS